MEVNSTLISLTAEVFIQHYELTECGVFCLQTALGFLNTRGSNEHSKS